MERKQREKQRTEGLRTEKLAVGYDKIPLIRDINLSVRPGEILTLIGPNGSGKSTILKTIVKQLKSLGGKVSIGQEAMESMSDGRIARKLSMVMTERVRTELQTGKEVVASGRYPYTGRFGILSREDWKKVDEAIGLVHAREVQDQDFMKISDGQRQRLMLARAICQDTEILILDEPTSYLDMGFKLDILSTIRMLARTKRIAVILSLHELDLAQKISDYIVCVKGDTIACMGTPEEIFSGDHIQRLYGVKLQSFDPLTGQMFLEAVSGTPKLFVISGAGKGIAMYHRLQREHIPFVAGILQENDMEFAAARALAVSVVAQKAFYPIGKGELEQAKQWIDRCEKCVCTLETFGPQNDANRMLKEYAKEQGKLIQH